MVDSEWMTLDSIKELTRLKDQGAPVIFKRWPKDPGVIKREEFQILINQMQQHEQAKLTDIKPILESDQILDFWCRNNGDKYYLFVSHSKMRNLRYPLEHGVCEKGRG